MNLEEKLYTSTEVAKILGVSLRSVYRYLEQGKLDAEIKTATGRLRFTKQNILDFLYPDGEENDLPGSEKSGKEGASKEAKQKEQKTEAESKTTTEEEEDLKEKAAKVKETREEASEEKEAEPEEIEEAEEPVEETEEKEEEEVDWLSKFKQAAQQYDSEPKPSKKDKEEAEKIANAAKAKAKAEAEEKQKEEEEKEAVSALSSFGDEEDSDEVAFKYYKSMLGGLKEVAQNIDKVSRKSGVNYAFTLYAGLSLEKPLKKPFSVLHSYIEPDAEPLFKKMLQLEETNEKNAQLCLMMAEDSKIFANKVEKHGLFVVADEQLVEDFRTLGLEEEVKELL